VPFYRYECLACREDLEAFQRLCDPPLTTCPVCGGDLLKQGDTAPPSPASRLSAADVPWTPLETDIHKGWKQRRKWKRDTMAAWKREERSRDRQEEAD